MQRMEQGNQLANRAFRVGLTACLLGLAWSCTNPPAGGSVVIPPTKTPNKEPKVDNSGDQTPKCAKAGDTTLASGARCIPIDPVACLDGAKQVGSIWKNTDDSTCIRESVSTPVACTDKAVLEQDGVTWKEPDGTTVCKKEAVAPKEGPCTDKAALGKDGVTWVEPSGTPCKKEAVAKTTELPFCKTRKGVENTGLATAVCKVPGLADLPECGVGATQSGEVWMNPAPDNQRECRPKAVVADPNAASPQPKTEGTTSPVSSVSPDSAVSPVSPVSPVSMVTATVCAGDKLPETERVCGDFSASTRALCTRYCGEAGSVCVLEGTVCLSKAFYNDITARLPLDDKPIIDKYGKRECDSVLDGTNHVGVGEVCGNFSGEVRDYCFNEGLSSEKTCCAHTYWNATEFDRMRKAYETRVNSGDFAWRKKSCSRSIISP